MIYDSGGFIILVQACGEAAQINIQSVKKKPLFYTKGWAELGFWRLELC